MTIFDPPFNQILLGNSMSRYDGGHLDSLLYELAQAVDKKLDGYDSGGYAQDFKNDVFEIHPYYWGECSCGYEGVEEAWHSKNKHKQECYQTGYSAIKYDWNKQQKKHEAAAKELCEKHGIDWNGGLGSAVHCTCDYRERWREFCKENSHKPECGVVLPNFRHFKTGIEVRWYKYIGRGMSCNKDLTAVEFGGIVKECIDSL